VIRVGVVGGGVAVGVDKGALEVARGIVEDWRGDANVGKTEGVAIRDAEEVGQGVGDLWSKERSRGEGVTEVAGEE
jgi:hypothetical protein